MAKSTCVPNKILNIFPFGGFAAAQEEEQWAILFVFHGEVI